MKARLLALVLGITVLIGGLSVNASSLDELTKDITKVTEITDTQLINIKTATDEVFTDYDKNSWYAGYVAKLIAVKGIKGYPDNTFKPNGTITRAEFLKILVASIYGEQIPTDNHWASGYIEKAESVAILSKGEISSIALDQAITRQEMAKYISLTMEKSLKEAKAINIEDVKRIITDKTSIGTSYANHVYNAYGKGIITGYTDKSFGPTKTATRAEASTMLVRMLDEKERIVVGVVKWEVTTINGWTLPAINYDPWKGTGIIYYELEEPGGTLSELNLRISAGEYAKINLVDQWAAAEMALKSKIDDGTVKSIMDYVKTKTNSKMLIDTKYYNTNKYEIKVSDSGGSVFINVWGK